MKTRRPLWPYRNGFLPRFIAVLTAVTACSSGSSSGSTSSANSSPINVGELLPLSGPYAGAGTAPPHRCAGCRSRRQCPRRRVRPPAQPICRPTQQVIPWTLWPALRQLQIHNLTFLVGPTSLEFASVQNIVESSQFVDFVQTPSPQFNSLYNPRIWEGCRPRTRPMAAGMGLLRHPQGA